MNPSASRLILALFGISAILSVDKVHGAVVPWDVDPSQSFIRLSIPDQSVSIDGTPVSIRLRSANNSAWSDTTGRRAFLDGTIATDLQSNSIEFLGGMHSLFALESGSFRPNPASWDPDAANSGNPDGQYADASGAPAAFAAKLRGSLTTTFDAAYLAFRDVLFDADSGAIALSYIGNSATFAGGANTFGIQSAAIDFDGLSPLLLGQFIPDVLHEPIGDLTGTNILGGGIELFTPFGTQLKLNVNVPVVFNIDGTLLNGSLSGQVVAYLVPEPSSLLLAGLAACGLCWIGRRRYCRREVPATPCL